MPKGKWIDKKTAQHFTLVHRPQNDPLIHDADAPSMVLNPTPLPNASKVRKLDDLASELGSDAEHIRANEGEAANHGVFFDDTEYDYMQHLRDLDSAGGGEVVFIEADNGPKNKGKGKQKQSLEDALRKLDVADEERKRDDLFGDDFLPSKNLQHITYQAQQEIPDAIGGFQPDMDPRLREVLEALEDEAYVDDDEDVFAQLAKDGRELEDMEFDVDFDEDEGWESDDTAKPTKEYKDRSEVPDLVPTINDQDGEVVKNEDWLDDFKKFKKDQGKPGAKVSFAVAPSQSEVQSSLMTTTTNGGRRKKRKGALTNQSGYSMTSSSLFRTEQLGILDARFDKIEEQYNADDFDDDEDGGASMSQISTASSVTGSVRGDFDNILDDFLGGYSMRGKKQMKKGKWKSGTAELDEIRRDLGPARIRGRYGQPQASGLASASASASASR
ncbi:Protein LTV1 [Daldinia childiae]|uniref:Protein LTV1 n=1 Tax=Daldinia childiae TaxID=326645 RepID=UPI00144713E6|nr:Protein LTV1 [Daldinia childiae]KAF3064033.1 Protein LTV1 [Daldinia childiae]